MRRVHAWSSSGAEPRYNASQDRADGDSRFRPSLRVLHVERDTFVAALVYATLQDAGFDVDWYPNPDTALAAGPVAEYDVCLFQTDLVGTRGTTVETVEKLARVAPIIFLADKLEGGPSVPRVSILPKPFSPHALVEAVETVVPNPCRCYTPLTDR